MAKEIVFRGKNAEALKKMSLNEFIEIVPSRIRRRLERGFTEQHKILLKQIEKNESNIKTHCRDMPILPIMIGQIIKVYSGKEFVDVRVEADMMGHVLGEFAQTRKRVQHSAPGIGATKSSSAVSVR
jgi:small subunit ribosomal protein S19